MKTHTIKTSTSKLLIVEMPEGAKIRYYTLKDNDFDGVGILQHHQKPYIITGSYTLLGKPDEVREEDVMELVEQITASYSDGSCGEIYFKYYNTNKGNVVVKTAKESLLSLLESAIYWDVNPIPKPDYFTTENSHIHLNTWSDFMHEWHEAEKKTFDRNRTLIFVKN